jgi:hypothetical protein
MKGFRLRRRRRRPGTARWPVRFRRMLSNRVLWPGMIGIALAVGIGVQMGESAIGAIDPIHFQGAAPPPQGIDPNAPPPASTEPTYAAGYGWADGAAARQADGAIPVEDFDYVPQTVVQRAAEPNWQPPLPPVSLAPWPPGQVSAHPRVERYTDFPVEDKPASRPAPARSAPVRPAPDQPPADEAEQPEPDAPPADGK